MKGDGRLEAGVVRSGGMGVVHISPGDFLVVWAITYMMDVYRSPRLADAGLGGG